jgi:hypothetical protein
MARIAADKSEQAIREKQEAEEAVHAINHKAIQEKLKAEEMARIAADRSEQAIREKQEAEETARIAANERDQARRNEIDLYDDIEIEIKKITKELEEKVGVLEKENRQLRLVNNYFPFEISNNASGKSLHNENDRIYFELEENDFYFLERRDLILNILKNANNINNNSRRYHLVQDLLRNNASTGRRETLKAEIQALFKNYTGMDESTQKKLESMGFEIISKKGHYKIRFYKDNRYMVTISSTPGCPRAGRNIASDICNLLT